MTRADLEGALRRAHGPSVVAYLTAGHPDRETFLASLASLETEADAIEIGIPFSDPMADGTTIQRASRVALAAGATLAGILADLAAHAGKRPRVLMSYLNPLLSIAPSELAPRLRAAFVSGVVVPDLPFEESGALRAALAIEDIALIPMVTPLTSDARMRVIAAEARGFVYAVTSTGITGQRIDASEALTRYLARVRAMSTAPVIAGFGVRAREHVALLCPPADGVVVGSAIVEAIEAGAPLDALVRALR
jgi:tryptophan synthase alpha chain